MAAAPNAEACDRLAASTYDKARPTGIQDHVIAQYNLGAFYANGLGGLPKDDQEAARLYRIAADQGVGAAQVNLGNLYLGESWWIAEG